MFMLQANGDLDWGAVDAQLVAHLLNDLHHPNETSKQGLDTFPCCGGASLDELLTQSPLFCPGGSIYSIESLPIAHIMLTARYSLAANTAQGDLARSTPSKAVHRLTSCSHLGEVTQAVSP